LGGNTRNFYARPDVSKRLGVFVFGGYVEKVRLYDSCGRKTYLLLLKLCGKYGVDPSSSFEMEGFFMKILAEQPKDSDLSTYLKGRPRWIQGRAWPLVNGQPMIFAGQIDIKQEGKDLFHDDTSLYVFIAKDSEPKMVLQQY
jgi:hypothetical protein